jgi:hypothetical protein
LVCRSRSQIGLLALFQGQQDALDASIKPLYGRQEGAEIGYNPTKPMRPSHVQHQAQVAHQERVQHAVIDNSKCAPDEVHRPRSCLESWAQLGEIVADTAGRP